MHFDIVWLNGTSSSGKTALAKELQALLDDHFLHVCFDTFYQMLPPQFKPTTQADSKYVEQVNLGFEYSMVNGLSRVCVHEQEQIILD
jgi:chloramphenicol 3-O-phosphotransferase